MEKTIEKKGYILVEAINCVNSDNESIGIVYTDLVGYLIGRVHNLKDKIIPSESKINHNQIKFQTSKRLIKIVKDLRRYNLK